MRISTGYRQILSISIPIMLASATQNIIVLADNLMLNMYDPLDFGAIGIVGVFYLMIASIGYGFSRGGQIIIARRAGQREYRLIGQSFLVMFLFELFIALGIFLFLQFSSPSFFALFIDNPDILNRCVDYIIPRSYGVFFSYLGVSLVSLYTGIARTKFLMYTTLVLTITNVVLDYALIFGHWGWPELGIAGAGWASTIAEGVAFVMFLTYMLIDPQIRRFHLLDFKGLQVGLFAKMFNLSTPVVLQSVLGLGSWFIFFAFIENIGISELAISNLIRNVYLVLSIPCWGFAAGINTMVSNLIGQLKRQAVIPIIKKTAFISGVVTIAITLPFVLFPYQLLSPLFGEQSGVVALSRPYLYLLLPILGTFSTGTIYMNGLIGIGETGRALRIQGVMTLWYIAYTYMVLKVWNLGLGWGWFAEVLYWAIMMFVVHRYLQSNQWRDRNKPNSSPTPDSD